MILTFFYVIATSVQSRRILFLKTHLRNIFQGSSASYPSIMFCNKAPLDSYKESKSSVASDYEAVEKFLTSSFCTNKDAARLGELLWYNGDMRLCTIYPQQSIDISGWLSYHYGRTLFPLYTNNSDQTLFDMEQKIYVLVEADLDSYEPIAAGNPAKIEDYGLIIAWTAGKNIGLVVETDLDNVTKFLIAAMNGECYINNGLLLKRIETVLVYGKPCLYNSDLLNPPPEKRFIREADWETHVEKLRNISDTARLASEQLKPVEVPEIPGILVYPDSAITEAELHLKSRAASSDTLDSGSKSYVSTPVSVGSRQPIDKSMESIAADLDQDSDGQPVTEAKIPEEPMEQERVLEEEAPKKEEVKSLPKPAEFIPQEIDESKLADPASVPKSCNVDLTSKLKKSVKPPNVLIYADSVIAVNNVKSVLQDSLGTEKYTVYALSLEEVRSDVWMENAVLMVVCGNVGSEIGSQMVEYILRGGKLLALCSDVLHNLLPSFKTAEVRENELVHFSYGKWKHVRMMHHVFCYQASPIRTRFSQDQEQPDVKVTGLHPPSSATVKDKRGKPHTFDVKVLGAEETWHTPSILLASVPGSSGKVVFSQIHLEVDPTQYEMEESKFTALKQSNPARLEIFNDLLSTHLGIELYTGVQKPIVYTPAFFLGRHELKLEMLDKLKDLLTADDILKMSKLDLQFCRGTTAARPASASLLPIMLHQCPDKFSTIEYFESLTTQELGRLVIYVDVMTSSMDVVNGHRLQHGLAVIPRQQTQGRGRGKNTWLSPEGCAMFTLQLFIPIDSVVGSCISILQHLVMVAVVSAIKSVPGYEELDLRIKWPNDFYAGSDIKIGGLIVTTQSESGLYICNVGVGVNLFNSEPTTCLNDMVKVYNEICGKNTKMISYEQFFALVFNEIETLLNIVQSGNMNALFEAYYKHWVHTDAEVTVVSTSGQSQRAKILGIDKYGFLRVRGEKGNTFTVQPDGNSFDALQGLIAPKH